MKQQLTEQLIHAYKEIYTKEGNPPQHYFQTKPTIPCIGEYYHKHRVLIYASAENLNDWIENKNNRPFFLGARAFNRHTEFWEGSKESNEKVIGIEPFDTGGLRLVGIICLGHLGFTLPESDDVLEHIAVGNISKFSLKRDKKNHNRDVSRKNLEVSSSYIQSDLEILKPELIVNASGKHGFLKTYFPEDKIINIQQYTHKQLGFYHLRKKISDSEVGQFSSELANLITQHQLPTKIKNKMEDRKNDDFVRYFCLLGKELHGIKHKQ